MLALCVPLTGLEQADYCSSAVLSVRNFCQLHPRILFTVLVYVRRSDLATLAEEIHCLHLSGPPNFAHMRMFSRVDDMSKIRTLQMPVLAHPIILMQSHEIKGSVDIECSPELPYIPKTIYCLLFSSTAESSANMNLSSFRCMHSSSPAQSSIRHSCACGMNSSCRSSLRCAAAALEVLRELPAAAEASSKPSKGIQADATQLIGNTPMVRC